jgi:hypothetical protein
MILVVDDRIVIAVAVAVVTLGGLAIMGAVIGWWRMRDG